MTIIIIVNYKGNEDTKECVDSIISQKWSDYKILIVDNSIDPFYFQDLYKSVGCLDEVICIKSPKNEGFAAGNNFGIEYLKKNSISYDYLWLLNNDTLVLKDSLTNFVERMRRESLNNSGIHILGGKLYRFSEGNILQGVGGRYSKYRAVAKHIGDGVVDTGQFDNDVCIDYPIGASMFVSKKFIDSVGGMYEGFFLYFEELDWVLRGERLGFKVGYEYSVRVIHKEGRSTDNSNRFKSFIADSCQVRNRIIITKKYYRKYLLSVLFFVELTLIKRLLYGEIKRFYMLNKVLCRALFKEHY